MPDQRPLWRKVFDVVEQAVAPGLEAAVKSDPFADVATVTMRLRADLARRTERVTRQALHFWNLPAGSDVKRVSDQIASLERRVRDLSKRIEDLTEKLDGQRSQPQRSRRSHSA